MATPRIPSCTNAGGLTDKFPEHPRFYAYGAGTDRLRWKFDPLSHGTERWSD